MELKVSDQVFCSWLQTVGCDGSSVDQSGLERSDRNMNADICGYLTGDRACCRVLQDEDVAALGDRDYFSCF